MKINKTRETLRLFRDIGLFNQVIMEKALEKLEQGYFGWDDPANEHLLVNGLI